MSLSVSNEQRVIFTSRDVNYLVRYFSISELWGEIHAAEVHKATARSFEEDDLEWWFEDYIGACQEALEIKRWLQSKPPKVKLAKGKVDVVQLKENIDLVDLISHYTQLRKSSRNFTGCCPIHEDKHPSLTVYPNTQRWWCYGCNRGGDAIDFIMTVESLDFKGAVSVLRGK